MNKIVIIGFMGSGKSSVARALAKLLNSEMIDLDEVIKRNEGRSAGQIIEGDGERVFRVIESQTLGEMLADSTAGVVALGGGAWLSETNRREISTHGGISVWLNAPFDLCWKRISASEEHRPLARNETVAQNLFAERLSCYRLADVHVTTTEYQSAEEIATEIVEAIATLKKKSRSLGPN